MKKVSLSILLSTMLFVGGSFALAEKTDKVEKTKETSSKIFNEEITDSTTEKEVKEDVIKGLYDQELKDGKLESITTEQHKELQGFVKDNLNEKYLISFDGKTYPLLNEENLTKNQISLLSDMDYSMAINYSQHKLGESDKSSSHIMINKQSELYDLRYASVGEIVTLTLDGKDKKLTVYDRVIIDKEDSSKHLRKMKKGIDSEVTVFTIQTNKGLVSVYTK